MLHFLALLDRTKVIERADYMDANPFVGAWRLLSSEHKDAGGRVTHRWGQNPCGILTYTADGFMCVVMSKAGRAHYASDSPLQGTDQERAEATRAFSSYAGRYEIVAAEAKVLDHVEIAMTPSVIGSTLERFYTFAGDHLTLVAGMATIVWERAALRR